MIRVRRANDNQELNIYAKFDGTLDVQTLESFCTGTNGFVTTWYDQSGQGRNATQTTDANQPQVIASGQLIRFNGTPCVSVVDNATTITQHLVIPVWHTASATNVWSFSVLGAVTAGGFPALLNSSPLDGGFRLYNGLSSGLNFIGSTRRNNTDSGASSFVASLGVTYLRVDQANRVNVNIWANNIAGTSASDLNFDFTMPSVYWIGNIDATATVFNNMRLIELIFYSTDQSSNRTSIQSNINSFYQIY